MAACSQPLKKEQKKVTETVKFDENGATYTIKNFDILVIEEHQYVRFYDETEFYNKKDSKFIINYPVVLHRPECVFCKRKGKKK